MMQTCERRATWPICKCSACIQWSPMTVADGPLRITVLGVAQDVAHDASTKVPQSLILRARRCPASLGTALSLTITSQKRVRPTAQYSRSRKLSSRKVLPLQRRNCQMWRWATAFSQLLQRQWGQLQRRSKWRRARPSRGQPGRNEHLSHRHKRADLVRKSTGRGRRRERARLPKADMR